MKSLLFPLFCIFAIAILSGTQLLGQVDCTSILKKAEAALNIDKNPRKALTLLQDAETCDYTNRLLRERQRLQSRIFDAVDALRQAAVDEKLRTEDALDQVQKEKAATEEQRKNADKAKQEAQSERDKAQTALANLKKANESIVELLLRNAKRDILNLRYEDALEKIKTADRLGTLNPEVVKSYIEIAFWHNEAGFIDRTIGILDTVFTMKKEELPLIVLNQCHEREQLRNIIENMDKNIYDSLNRRYYPYMVPIKAGIFQMGCNYSRLQQTFGDEYQCPNNELLHTVILDNYYIAETETTWWQYDLYLKATGKNINADSLNEPPMGNHPVIYVDWYDAIEYANWVSEQFNVESAYFIDKEKQDPNNHNNLDYKKWSVNFQINSGYRLPTEAEWEYASSTNNQDVFAGTSSLDSLYFYGNYDDDGAKDKYSNSSPSKTFLPNRWGLYDMSGNVWEWCWDWYDSHYNKNDQVNPFGPVQGTNRVRRGGSWDSNPKRLRCSYRLDRNPADRRNFYGFRLAKGT